MKESKEHNYFINKKLETLYTKAGCDIFSEYRTSDPTTFSRNYNILLNPDGTVFDNDLKMVYDTLSDWMKSLKGIKK